MAAATTAASAGTALSRDALIEEAISLGYKREELERTTTYSLGFMVAERKKKKSKKPEQQTHRSGAHDVREYSERIAETAAVAPVPSVALLDDNDDAKTVVNMDFITSTENPADQKYKRFSFLVAAKNDLIKAIKTNTALLQTNLTSFDEDDVQVIRREIEHSQYQLGLVNTEIREINQWFSEVHQQKHVFYQQFLQSSADVSGQLTQHFQRKMDNIKKYTQAMHEQSQLHPEDLK